MARTASKASPRPRPASRGPAEDVLRRAQLALNAAFVAVRTTDGTLTQTLARDVPGARVLEDLWSHGADDLLEQVRAAKGALGTNRLRGQSDGPVCGKLVAAALRDASGAINGLIVAMRTVEQEKFGKTESRLLADLAAELASQVAATTTTTTVSLLSWSAFLERARAQEGASGGSAGCILYGDVDQLHVLNKLAGLTAGDQAIAAAAAALQDQPLPEGAGVCHISGDRFAVYLPKASLNQARRVAEQLCRAVGERCANIGGLRTRLSVSFGVASVPAGDQELDQALAAAEAACRAAKDHGRGRVEVYQETDQSIVRRNEDVLVANRLRKSLETERIGIVAQPLVSLSGDCGVEYYELLVRLVSDSGTFVSPAQFMSAATRYQMLIDLDRTMLTRVFDRLNAARSQIASRRMRFSINLSGPSIGNPDFHEWLSSHIGPDSVPGEWLQFEITETAAVANVSQTQSMIRRLRARGAEFALDDFGTGVSSFAYLKEFDVSMLKLDGSFTRDLLTNTRSESLVRGIAQLACAMGIHTVAECVESELVRQKLAEIGVERAQGFLFGQPVPLESIFSGPLLLASPPSVANAAPAPGPAPAPSPASTATAEPAEADPVSQSLSA